MNEVPTHHLVYGTLNDYVTGEELTDTDDERTRQELSRMMVEKLGYEKEDLEPRCFIETLFSTQFVRSNIELAVSLKEPGKKFLIIRYGAGSLVSRERSAIAAARVLEKEYQIPLAVVTNGRDAELLDTATGEVLATGMDAIPSRDRAQEMLPELEFRPPAEGKKREGELRILNAFDVEICCRSI
ncbi:MAG: type I restriction enzyme HsdR N-terminal domain-containing protein [Thermodesulfobacteriota bacterium]|nr:type I restriction enzyme HsdR N-terminal domain-containing protein [Thermodesulfobacteriota bacterium]